MEIHTPGTTFRQSRIVARRAPRVGRGRSARLAIRPGMWKGLRMAGKRATAALADEPYINLATFRRSGAAVETPVWCAPLDGKLYVVTDGTSAKVKRIRASKRIRVAPCGVRGAVTGEWVEGRARIVADAALVARAHAALVEKYGWQMWLLDTGSRLFGRYARRAYLELILA